MVLARVRWQHDRGSELHDTNILQTEIEPNKFRTFTEDDQAELKAPGKGELRNLLSNIIWRVDSRVGGFVEIYGNDGGLRHAHPNKHEKALRSEIAKAA